MSRSRAKVISFQPIPPFIFPLYSPFKENKKSNSLDSCKNCFILFYTNSFGKLVCYFKSWQLRKQKNNRDVNVRSKIRLMTSRLPFRTLKWRLLTTTLIFFSLRILKIKTFCFQLRSNIFQAFIDWVWTQWYFYDVNIYH